MSPASEPMTSVDHSWLRMESSGSNMHIGAVLILETPVNIAMVQQLITERLLRFSRFTQRVVAKRASARWQTDPDFDLDNHILCAELQDPASEEELRVLAGRLMNQPLARQRPLWCLHFVPDFQGGSALIVRIHHCIADGMALVKVLLSLTDDCADPAAMALCTDKPTMAAGSRDGHSASSTMGAPAQWFLVLRKVFSALAELVRISFARADSGTPLKGTRSGVKQVAWAQPFALADVKRIAGRTGTTVNDVLVAALAGALRQYFLQQLAAPQSSGLHVSIPFNLRPQDAPIQQLGNQVGLVLLPLPVQVEEPLQRLLATKQAMDKLKHSYQAHVFYGLLELIGKGPSSLEQAALKFFSSKASAIMTNVPGPRDAIYLAGARVRQPLAWVPQAGSVGVGFAILTYNGKVQFSILADSQLIPDPIALVDMFIAQFRELEMLVDGDMHVAADCEVR